MCIQGNPNTTGEFVVMVTSRECANMKGDGFNVPMHPLSRAWSWSGCSSECKGS